MSKPPRKENHLEHPHNPGGGMEAQMMCFQCGEKGHQYWDYSREWVLPCLCLSGEAGDSRPKGIYVVPVKIRDERAHRLRVWPEACT